MLASIFLAASTLGSGPRAASLRIRIPTLGDTIALESLVRNAAKPIAARHVVLQSIAIVGNRAIVDWYARRIHGAIEGGGSIVARERARIWSLIGTSDNYPSLSTLKRIDPRLSPTQARAILTRYRFGVTPAGCNAITTCSTARDRITTAVLLDALNKRSFVIAPVVWPIATAGRFALADWTEGEGGGETLLESERGRWRILAMGGGSIASTSALESEGVSAKTARTLVRQIVAGERAPERPCSPTFRCIKREREVRIAFSRYVKSQRRSKSQPIFHTISIAGTFAVADYSIGASRDQALLRLRKGSWRILADGPEWIADSGLLIRSFGVPPADAIRLERQIIDAAEKESHK